MDILSSVNSVSACNNIGIVQGARAEVDRHLMMEGFKLTLLLCGKPGSGKYTLAASLFKDSIENGTQTTKTLKIPANNDKSNGNILHPDVEGVIRETKFEIVEDGFHGEITIADTPTYGIDLDNSFAWVPVYHYITQQYDDYIREQLKSVVFPDTRIHACVYFINPNGLEDLDLLTLKQLCKVVNIIPVISKSDGLTSTELLTSKKKITAQLKENDIQIFEFPGQEPFTPFAIICSKEKIHSQNYRITNALTQIMGELSLLSNIKHNHNNNRDIESESVGTADLIKSISDSCQSLLQLQKLANPISTNIATSSTATTETGEVENGGVGITKVRGREYPWGTIEIENPSYSDFAFFRHLILNNRLLLTKRMHELLFHKYRSALIKKEEEQRKKEMADASEALRYRQELEDQKQKMEIEKEKTAKAQREAEELARKLADMEERMRQAEEMQAIQAIQQKSTKKK